MFDHDDVSCFRHLCDPVFEQDHRKRVERLEIGRL
jgi:hypothetical protein